MEILREGAVAFFQAAGIAAVLWVLFDWLLYPRRPVRTPVYIPLTGDAQELEHAIRGILWLREVGLTSGGVYLLDVGLSETGGRIVQALCEKWEFVTLLPEERLSDLFKTGS